MTEIKSSRLLSLDFFRGITMLLLVGESARVFHHWIKISPEGSFSHKLALQFTHAPWEGLHFWDLVQPFFMFIVGVAMVFSISNRLKHGADKKEITRHILQRCLILFILGLIRHISYNQELVWELWNVLIQLSFTILVAYLIFDLPVKSQLMISIALILLSDLLYRFTNIPGFDQPFVADQNFGSWMDLALMGKLSGGHWIAFNAIPTAAHTIWGVLAGKLLIGTVKTMNKVKVLMWFGVAGLVIGYGLDILDIVPIIKRTCTSAFVIASGGWCLITLAVSYWVIDIKAKKKWVIFFSVVGMNSILIYMVPAIFGPNWFTSYLNIYLYGFMDWFGAGEHLKGVIGAIVAWSLLWYICYWMYKRKIFIKI